MFEDLQNLGLDGKNLGLEVLIVESWCSAQWKAKTSTSEAASKDYGLLI